MSRTYKDQEDYRRPAEGERPGRYRPGSRKRRRNLVAIPTRHEEPDLRKFGRAVIEVAMRLSADEAEAMRAEEGKEDA